MSPSSLTTFRVLLGATGFFDFFEPLSFAVMRVILGVDDFAGVATIDFLLSQLNKSAFWQTVKSSICHLENFVNNKPVILMLACVGVHLYSSCMTKKTHETLAKRIDLEQREKAVARLRTFLSLETDELLQHLLSEEERGLLDRSNIWDLSPDTIDTPNRRLALAMLGLEEAVRVLYEQAGCDVTRESIVINRDGEEVPYHFSASQAGSDFGMVLGCRFSQPKQLDAYGRPHDSMLHVLLPTDGYLYETLAHGDPHEPQFFASEPDIYSAEWSEDERERLPNGGVTYREINGTRSLYDESGTYIPDPADRRRDVYHRDRVHYRPLYTEDAPGIERYMRITQTLIAQYLEAIEISKRSSS